MPRPEAKVELIENSHDFRLYNQGFSDGELSTLKILSDLIRYNVHSSILVQVITGMYEDRSKDVPA